MRNPWFDVAMEMTRLGIEAQTVIALRTARLMTGGAASEAECSRMVSEKMEAAADAGLSMMVGTLQGRSQAAIATQVTKAYRRQVAANRRRLMRGPAGSEAQSSARPPHGGT